MVWQKAQGLAVEVEKRAEVLRYDAADPLRRSTASVADNLAEGSERPTDADFARFVGIAEGSCAEAQCQLRRAVRCGHAELRPLIIEAQQVGWMLTALRRRLTAGPAP